METKLHLLILFVTILKCNGHVPILSDILSGTHSIIHGVAGGVIDHISQGFRLNLDGKFDVNKKVDQSPQYGNQPHIGPQEKPEQTIVVIVEKEHNHHHHHRPHDNNNGQYGPGYNEYRPNQNGPGRPDYGVNGNYGNQDFIRPRPNVYDRPFENNGNYNGNQGQNNYQNQYNKPNTYPPNNYGNPGYDRPYYPPQHNNELNNNREDYNKYGHNPQPNYGDNFNNGPPRPNQFNNDIPNGNPGNQNNYNTNNNFKPTGYETSTVSEFVNPSTGFPISKPSSTKKPDEDVPLFIPLNPEDKDDMTNSAPKRETDKKPVDQDEDFELDIRIKD